MKGSSKDTLIEALRILHQAGFSISEVDSEQYCLQLVAKKGDVKLLIKTLENVDSERREAAEELKSLATATSSSPLIIGSRIQCEKLEEGALYERYGVNVVSPETFTEATLKGKLPFVQSKRGGLYFRINGRTLKRLREERKMSLGDLAKRIGVSRKAVYEYETGGMGATLETVARIEEVFNIGLTQGIDIFDWHSTSEPEAKAPSDPAARQLHWKLKEIGCKAMGFDYAPIDVHARTVGVSFLTKERGLDKDLESRVESALELAKLLDMVPVLVTGEGKPNGADIYVLRTEEVKQLKTVKDLEQLLGLEAKDYREYPLKRTAPSEPS
jgi:putative transcriptional regulator